MDDGTVRFGILGCASIARKMSRAMLMTPGVCLYAVGSRSLEKAQSFARANGFPPETKVYGSYESVLDDEAVDAVYIPLPTVLHLEWVLKAAERKKHVLLEKPPAVTVEDLERMILSCEKNGVQLMDCTMWVHHPRAAKLKEILTNQELFGELLEVHATIFVGMPPSFFKENIRVSPNLDPLGVLGDVGWYCIRAFLWAFDYELPISVTALPGAKFNETGVILSCGACFLWQDGCTATFHCSFLTQMRMALKLFGTSGILELDDFVIPSREDVAHFKLSTNGRFEPLDIGLTADCKDYEIHTSLPQESLMVQSFSKLVIGIRSGTGRIDPSWSMFAKKTQQLLNAVKLSIDRGNTPVTLSP